MGDKDWKTEYSCWGTRVAKGHGSTPEEADRKAKQQLNEKGIKFHIKAEEAKS